MPRTIALVASVVLAVCQPIARARAQAPQAQSWDALDRESAALYEKGDVPRALEASRAALKAAGSPRERGRSLDRIGFLSYTAGNLPDGERYLRESLAAREAAFGPDSLEYAESANDLAMVLRDERRMDEAKSLAGRAVATRQRLLGDGSLPLAESLDTLGTVEGLAGDYLTAVSHFERALAIHEAQPPASRASEEYGTLCINLAGTYQRIGKYLAAETTFRKGLDSLKVKPGVEHPAYAASLLAAAGLEVDLGRYADAERMYDEGGRLLRAELGEQHPFFASYLNNRGFFYQTIGNAAAAEADYQKSLDLKLKLFGLANPVTLASLRNLAHLTYARDPRAGEQLLARAVDAYAALPNAPAFDFTSVLVGLARARRDRGALADARATAERALDVSRTGLGERHPLYAAATRELGLTLAAAGDSAAAERELREALRIAEQVHGPQHPDVAPFLDALGDFYAARQRFQAAEELYARSLDIQDRFSSDVLEIGSESFKTSSLATANDPLPRLIAFQARAAASLPAARALAFEAVAERKGRVIEHVRGWRERLESNPSRAIRRQAAEWQALLECRTSLTVALGYRDLKPGLAGSCSLTGTDLEGRYERLLSDLRSRWTPDVGAKAVDAIRVLRDRADRVEAALNRETGAGPASTSRPTLAGLRGQLGADEALVEFVAYGDEPRRGRRYGAFVLTHAALDWADLGPAGPIDLAVSDLLGAARDWSVSTATHEPEAARTSQQTARLALGDLSTRVWRPVRASVADPGLHHLRIAPDDALNLVPFEALSDGHDLIDRFAISYVPAGRDLIAAAPRAPESGPVVVVSPGASAARAARAPQGAASFRAQGLLRLEDAVSEAADIKRVVPATTVLTGTAATERHVKALHGPSLLHIVGHGVVRAGDDCQGRPCGAAPLDPSAQAMSMAAIVLEEAYGRGAGSSDDGMLTALELQNMDLRGTEMLVLSQCQMASGLASVGEGVYGMRRAAAIAGVHSFVAPLWNVEDRVERRLMNRFYGALAAGATRADALRRAKLAIKRTPGTASFLFWAPVILSGSPGALPASLFGR
ncbi:MAG TPA: CHAT domain-containing tetratricopeptide repeat protein [Vicinamibacterales bacterium]|nr:CHAT domain-containing tetratricopeptide repeat protein [Vicinamibacterales bacterium]